MNQFILYTAISQKKEYIYCVQLLIKTLELYTKDTKPIFDILILHDEVLEEHIKNSFNSNKFTIFTHKPESVAYSNPEFFYKLKYFDFPLANNYKKAFYLDADILVTTDITQFFNLETSENKLYVFPEDTGKFKHNEYYYNPYYPNPLPNECIEKYSTQQIYVFNSGTFLFEVANMKQHFDKVIELIIEHKKGAFMDQPFINYYFNQIQAPVYIFNKDNYQLGVDKSKYTNDCILHFAGTGIGNSLSKFQMMFTYYKDYILPNKGT